MSNNLLFNKADWFAVESHPNYKRTEGVAGDTLFRFILANRDDPAREIMVTVLAFELPEPSA